MPDNAGLRYVVYESSDTKQFLLDLLLLENVGLSVILMILLIYRGAYLKTGLLILLVSSLAICIVNVSSSTIVWTNLYCRSVSYIITYICWRIKDFGLRAYILIRTNSLTFGKLRFLIYSLILYLFLLNLLRTICVFLCLNNDSTNFFIQFNVVSEKISLISMFIVDLFSIISVLAFQYFKRPFQSKAKINLLKLVDQNTFLLFLIVLIMSIPSYIMIILVAWNYAQSEYAFMYSFVENLTLLILAIEFLNINISTRSVTSGSYSIDSN